MKLNLVACEAPPADLRELYFLALGEPQVHYLEKRVAAARAFRFGGAEPENGGYLAVHDGAVVEFFAGAGWLPRFSEAFHAAAAQAGAASAIVKSYDAQALVAVAGRPTRVASIGVNCTAWSDERYDPPPGFDSRAGAVGDRDLIAAIGPGLFETPEEMMSDLEAGRIRVFELDGEAVGCGVLSPVREGADAYDLGVGVLPAWRRKGVGEQIVRRLKIDCLRQLGVRPTCGCAVENLASRRTLEKAGFLTRHRLLEFRWESQ
ncbi:MAG: GNAT family N-acetyltransferase [Caulobacteraceae bacterium]